MQESDNVSIVRKIFDAHNRKNFDQVIAENVSDQLELTSCAFPQILRGKEGFRQYFRLWDTAIPESKIEVLKTLSSGDFVVAEALGRGAQQADFKSPYGVLPATGRNIELRFCEIFGFRDGQLVSFHNYFDMASLFNQAGMKWDFEKLAKNKAA
jgi:steroid delta-isomerase-like uncharacterized protein